MTSTDVLLDKTNDLTASISEVLADTTTLLAIISDNNAADYLARSTTWASSVVADSTAMTYIGADDYCADTLLSDSTWLSAIANSTYFESVLNVKVPTMTSNTTPSGTAGATSIQETSNDAWNAFDNNTSKAWGAKNTYGGSNYAGQYVWYDFGYSVKVYKCRVRRWSTDRMQDYKIRGSSDGGSTWTDLYSITNSTQDSTFLLTTVGDFQIYSAYIVRSTSGTNMCSIVQFWGRATT